LTISRPILPSRNAANFAAIASKCQFVANSARGLSWQSWRSRRASVPFYQYKRAEMPIIRQGRSAVPSSAADPLPPPFQHPEARPISAVGRLPQIGFNGLISNRFLT